ncbi:unnamed protein product, partial [Nesidiocoris tenuis]
MNPPSTGSLSLLSTSPSQDPPPPPGNQPGGKEPPSDAGEEFFSNLKTRSWRVSRATRRVQRLEDRPKWGVNRPPMRYIKASDRYPFSRTRNDTDDSR